MMKLHVCNMNQVFYTSGNQNSMVSSNKESSRLKKSLGKTLVAVAEKLFGQNAEKVITQVENWNSLRTELKGQLARQTWQQCYNKYKAEPFEDKNSKAKWKKLDKKLRFFLYVLYETESRKVDVEPGFEHMTAGKKSLQAAAKYMKKAIKELEEEAEEEAEQKAEQEAEEEAERKRRRRVVRHAYRMAAIQHKNQLEAIKHEKMLAEARQKHRKMRQAAQRLAEHKARKDLATPNSLTKYYIKAKERSEANAAHYTKTKERSEVQANAATKISAMLRGRIQRKKVSQLKQAAKKLKQEAQKAQEARRERSLFTAK